MKRGVAAYWAGRINSFDLKITTRMDPRFGEKSAGIFQNPNGEWSISVSTAHLDTVEAAKKEYQYKAAKRAR